MFRVDYVGTAPYVSCIPSVIHHRLSSSDRFLVLSSDGLYQYFNNEEVVAHVTWFMENVPEGDPAQYLIAELLFRAAKKNGQWTKLVNLIRWGLNEPEWDDILTKNGFNKVEIDTASNAKKYYMPIYYE